MHELRSLLPYLKPYRRAYLVGLALVVVSNFFADPAAPVFSNTGIDALRDGGEFHEVKVAVALLLPVALAGGVARYGMRELLNSGSRRVETDLRDQLYDHLQRMSAEFYDRYPTGDVMARTTNDLLAVRMVAGPALMYLVDTTIRALLVAPAMVAISPRLTLLALMPLLGLPVAMVSLGQHDSSPIPGDPGPVQRAHQPRTREPVRRARGPIVSAGAAPRSQHFRGTERRHISNATWGWPGFRARSSRCSPCWAV